MKKIDFRASDVRVVYEADVVVIGGGPAGFAAAVAAARKGLNVLLIERYGYMGGLCSGGLVLTVPEGGNVFRDEFEARLIDMNAAVTNCKSPVWEWSSWDGETYKYLCIKMCEEAGVNMLFHSWCIGVNKDGDKIERIFLLSKAGITAVKAKMFIDCTGDGDLAEFADIPFEFMKDGTIMPTTMMWNFAGVNADRYKDMTIPKFDDMYGDKQAVSYVNLEIFNKNILNVWGGTFSPSSLDPWELTKCENDSRKLMYEYIYPMIKKQGPGCKNVYPSTSAPQLGIREGRFICGMHTMTLKDLTSDAVYDDTIGITSEGRHFAYGALVPQKISNILFAGRCISMDQDAQNLLREVQNCFATGFAAGIATDIILDSGCAAKDIDINKLQSSLKNEGVRF